MAGGGGGLYTGYRIPCPNFRESRFPGSSQIPWQLTFPEFRPVVWSNLGSQEHTSGSG